MKRMVQVESPEPYKIEGNINKVVEYLRSLQEKYGQETIVELSADRDMYDSVSLTVTVSRPETEAEATERLALYNKHLEINKENRRKQYEALKQEFEGGKS